MLIRLAVENAPHVEPGGRVGLAGLTRVRILAHEADHDQIAFGDSLALAFGIGFFFTP